MCKRLTGHLISDDGHERRLGYITFLPYKHENNYIDYNNQNNIDNDDYDNFLYPGCFNNIPTILRIVCHVITKNSDVHCVLRNCTLGKEYLANLYLSHTLWWKNIKDYWKECILL